MAHIQIPENDPAEKRRAYHREYKRKRRQNDPDFLERSRAHSRESARRRREADPVAESARQRTYKSTDAYRAAARFRNRERSRNPAYRAQKAQSQARRYRACRWLNLLSAARVRAKKKALPFSLSKEWATARWTGRCELTGVAFYADLGEARSLSPSIDRIDNSRGYTPDNCRFVLWAINRFKGEGTDDEMLTIARLLVKAKDGELC